MLKVTRCYEEDGYHWYELEDGRTICGYEDLLKISSKWDHEPEVFVAKKWRQWDGSWYKLSNGKVINGYKNMLKELSK